MCMVLNLDIGLWVVTQPCQCLDKTSIDLYFKLRSLHTASYNKVYITSPPAILNVIICVVDHYTLLEPQIHFGQHNILARQLVQGFTLCVIPCYHSNMGLIPLTITDKPVTSRIA